MDTIQISINEELDLENIDFTNLSNNKLISYMKYIQQKHEQQKQTIIKLLDKVDKEELVLDELEKKYMKILEVFKERNIIS